MWRSSLSKWTRAAGTALAILLAHPAAAQCVMCYLSAGSSGERGAQVLRMGILVLAVPTLLIFAGLFVLAYRRREPAGRAEQPAERPEAVAAGPLPVRRPPDLPSLS